MTDIEKAKAELIAKINALPAPSFSPGATPDEVRALSEHLKEFARLGDAYVEVLGKELAYHTSVTIDLSVFTCALMGAVDGNALCEIESAADEIEVDDHEARLEARAGRRAA